jgi:DNA-binding MarR family transcriptional regulator
LPSIFERFASKVRTFGKEYFHLSRKWSPFFTGRDKSFSYLRVRSGSFFVAAPNQVLRQPLTKFHAGVSGALLGSAASTSRFAFVSPQSKQYEQVSKLMAREDKADRLVRSPLHMLHRASQCAGDVFHGEIGGDDLTPRQYAVLLTVSQHEGISQTGLVERTGVDRSTLADIVRRMLKKGLLQRRRTKEDARAYAVKLTEEGRRQLKLADPVARRVDDRILDALPTKQREQFLDDLAVIVAALAKFPARGAGLD